jgi:hypothetical protein
MKLHNEELHNLYASPNIRAMKSRRTWVGRVARMGELENAYKVLVGKRGSSIPRGRPGHSFLTSRVTVSFSRRTLIYGVS